MLTRTFSRKSFARVFLFLGLLLLILMQPSWVPVPSRAQTKSAYSKERLLTAIQTNTKTKELSTLQLVEYIEQRGVDFEMAAPDEARFRTAGASSEVIAAIYENYRPPKGFGALTIRTTISECRVLINDQPSGATDHNGLLRIKSLKAGTYKITLKKASYEEIERSITILSGVASKESFALSPLKATLTVVPSTSGASVRLGGTVYPTGITNLSIPPETYEVQVSKPGFKTFSRTITLNPGQPLTVDALLEPVPVEDSLARAASFLEAKRFREVISLGREVLATHPDNATANLLTGLGYYYSDLYADSTGFLTKSIALGEQVFLPIKHHHAAFLSDDLCTGTIAIGKGVLAFTSIDRSGHDFSVPAAKILELSPEPGKFGRVHVKVGVQNGTKEDKKTYNFHVVHSFLYQPNPNASQSFVRCNNCGEETALVYQLIKQLKDGSSQSASKPQLEADNGTAGLPVLKRRPAESGLGSVAPPSATYRSYSSAAKFKLDVPDNWKEITKSISGVVLAPDGSYTKVGARYNFSRGAQIGTIPVQNLDLPHATEQLLSAILKDGTVLEASWSHSKPGH